MESEITKSQNRIIHEKPRLSKTNSTLTIANKINTLYIKLEERQKQILI